MGRLGLPFLMNMVIFYRYDNNLLNIGAELLRSFKLGSICTTLVLQLCSYSGAIESTIFQGRVADYLFMWIFGAFFLLVGASLKKKKHFS